MRMSENEVLKQARETLERRKYAEPGISYRVSRRYAGGWTHVICDKGYVRVIVRVNDDGRAQIWCEHGRCLTSRGWREVAFWA